FRQDNRRIVPVFRSTLQRPPGNLPGGPDPELVQVGEEVRRIVVHAIGARPLELLLAIASREQPNPQSARSLGGEQVPDAVPDHKAVAWRDAKALGGSQEEVWVRLRIGNLVAGDDRGAFRYAQHRERRAGSFLGAAGGDRPGYVQCRKRLQQLARPRQRPDLIQSPEQRCRVRLAKLLG